MKQEGWPIVRFGDVARNVKVTVDPETSGLDRYIAGEHMDSDDLRLRRWGTIGDGYLGPAFHRKFVAGQILYGSRRTYLRKVAVADFDGVCANTTFVIEPKGDLIEPDLLPFIMQSEGFTEHSVANSKGSVNPYVNWKDIASYEFALPPKDEQRWFAEILWAAEDVVRKQRAVLNKIEYTIRVVRHDFFLRNWQHKRLDELFELQLGKMLSKKARRGLSPRPYLANGNVQWGRFDLDEVREMDFSEDELDRFLLRPGDLLVCEGGEVGRSAIWQGQIPGCCYQKALHRLRPISDEIDTRLLLQYMFFAARRGLFARLTGHSTIAHLTAVKLKGHQVPVPPLHAQTTLLAILDQLSETFNLTSFHLQASVELKKSLLRQLHLG